MQCGADGGDEILKLPPGYYMLRVQGGQEIPVLPFIKRN
jgi:hypothetical protein